MKLKWGHMQKREAGSETNADARTIEACDKSWKAAERVESRGARPPVHTCTSCRTEESECVRVTAAHVSA